MLYGDTPQEIRKLFFLSWEKYCNNEILLPLEQQIVDVICAHPEYHNFLQGNINSVAQAVFPSESGHTNPFLHMGLHLAVRDQITTNRPVGIINIYKKLMNKYNDTLLVEHLLMDKLANCLWHAQCNNTLPDEVAYLQAISSIPLDDY